MRETAAISIDGAEATDANIRMVNIEKRFGDQVAVRDLSLEIIDRELLVVLGPSGCGKSTTLSMLAGLETPTTGEIYFGSERVTAMPPEERNIAMVFQSIALYPNRNVQDNILFALKVAKVPKETQQQRLRDVTRLLGIDRYLGRRIHQLSGGERQRVAIAKALVKRPSLFLLDEPFSNLDAEMRRELRGELVRIHRELETTMLFVTHDQEEAMAIADRMAVMNRGELIQLGTPTEIYERPTTMWVARFVGVHPVNLLETELQLENGQPYARTNVARLPLDRRVFDLLRRGTTSDRVVLAIRPEAARLSPNQSSKHALPVSVHTRQLLGNEFLYELTADDHKLRAIGPSHQRFEIGDRVHFDFSWDHTLWFDATSEQMIAFPA